MKPAIEFRIGEKELCGEPFHYTLSGLDDIYLLNGFKIHNTPHGQGVAIEHADELHKAIGLHLVTSRKALGPKDMRFLRKNMRFTQSELARCLGLTSQTVARYEKGSTEIPGPADRLMRIVYAFHLMEPEQRQQFMDDFRREIEEIEEFDETVDAPIYFQTTAAKWDEARLS